MRIVGGRFRGRDLATPKSDAIRPTSDRLRETMFNVLHHAHGNPVDGARVMDLFAGTGALGLEALSRGATFCTFVEDGAEGRALIRGNVEKLGLTGVTKVWRRDATALGPAAPNLPADLVFLDPPYGRGLGERALASLTAGRWLAPQAIIVLEEATGVALQLPAGLEALDRREVGAGTMHILRMAAGV